MSFTVSDIKIEAQGLIDETILDADAIVWANACMAAMGSYAWRELAQIYAGAVKGRWYALPAGFIRTVAVRETIGVPVGLTVTATGVTGAATWGYQVSAVNETGETIACTEAQVTNGNATLSASNYNALAWTAVTGATSYNVYRVTVGGTPATTGLIGSPATNSLNDTGLAGDGSEVPFEDSSGDDYSSYTIRNRKIMFDDAGSYALMYTSYPTKLTAATGAAGTPDLPDFFMYPMSKYMASRFRSKDDSEDPDALRWMGEFQRDLADVLSEMELTSEAFQVKEVW